MAIMMGFDMVRVGMEDSVYMYPHKDEKIRTSADAVRKIRTIAEAMGREIATPDEARQILGIKPRQAAATPRSAVA
jgi:3-keto-5-aminohexanoate cleavage enzyme